LPLLTLASKHRFVFSDQEIRDDRQAAVKIDLNITSAHTLNDTDYQATLIEADQATSILLEDRFEAALAEQAQSNNTKFQTAEEFDAILNDLKRNFTIFRQVIIEGGAGESAQLKGDYRIQSEGIYNTYFFFARKLIKHANPTPEEDDDLLSDFEIGGDERRLLKAPHQVDWSLIPHLVV
jgi:hypothetical protein